MSKAVFRFKQFSVRHSESGMKVGTDGVLLGAWAEAENPLNILDIGCGSGLIALMLAQRFDRAKITGVEISEEAAKEANFNFSESPFAHRCESINSSVQNFFSPGKFDLIVSNPPYFKWTHKGEPGRTAARQQSELDFESLLLHTERLLTLLGKAAFIIPRDSENHFLYIAESLGLYPLEITRVRGNPGSHFKRSLLGLGRFRKEPLRKELTVELSRNVYTREYIALTREFYLKM